MDFAVKYERKIMPQSGNFVVHDPVTLIGDIEVQTTSGDFVAVGYRQ